MQTIGEREPLHGELGRFYDAIENPRKTRGELPILRDAELRAYMADVRERTLEVLDEVEIGADAEDPLLREGFVYEMLLAHELQHNETMLQLLQMVDGYEPLRADARHRAPSRSPAGPETVAVEAGELRDRRAADAASPTTTSAPATRSSWPPSRSIEPRSPTPRTPSSWRRPAPSRRCTGSATARAAGSSTAMGRRAPSTRPARHPRLLGRRPTPSPAGPASGCRPSRSGRRPRPQLQSGRRRSGSGPSSDFLAYPGFEAFPYPEYSEVFFGDELQGAARRLLGDPSARRPAQLPQLGPAAAAPDLRRPALREGRRDAIAIDGPPRRRRRARRWRATSAPASPPTPKELAPKYFYDERGSQLFEQITELPEYYPTRAEREILSRALGRDPRRRRRPAAPWSSSAPARPRRPATC